MALQDNARAASEAAAMRRAIELGRNGPERGVNPRVGCVIIGRDGKVIAEGWHRGAGTAHAEVDALSALPDGGAAGATAIVTLEPCNHTGRTGPCAEALIAAGVARVVYAVSDPGDASSGGAARLAAAGVDVESGIEREAATELLGDWLPTAITGRPRVTVKWASSLDGRAAAADGSSFWVTGPAARADVHSRRATFDAIAAGTGTVIADDPALTARRDDGSLAESQPAPVVFGTRAVPDDAAVRRHPRALRTLSGQDLAADLRALRADGVRSLLVEGGPRLASAFISAGLADELLIYLAPALIGGPITAIGDIGVGSIDQTLRLHIDAVHTLGDDLLIVARPKGTE